MTPNIRLMVWSPILNLFGVLNFDQNETDISQIKEQCMYDKSTFVEVGKIVYANKYGPQIINTLSCHLI